MLFFGDNRNKEPYLQLPRRTILAGRDIYKEHIIQYQHWPVREVRQKEGTFPKSV